MDIREILGEIGNKNKISKEGQSFRRLFFFDLSFKLKSRNLKRGVNSGIIKQMRELLQIREESINND